MAVSIDASNASAAPPLDAVLHRAGAVFANRHSGAPIAVNYGSAAGELAVCVTGAGLADCSELIKLEISGSPETLTSLSVRFTGAALTPRGAVLVGGAWWCGEPAATGDAAVDGAHLGRLIVLCDPRAGARLRGRLQGMAAQWPALRLLDRTSEWSAIAVVGGRAGQLLARLGVYGPSGDPRQTPPFARLPVGGVPARWLLQSDHRALALVDRGEADCAWHAIEQAGAGLGICCIGQDALARHALLERRRGLSALA